MDVYYIYMVVCSDASLYTGYTDNLPRRIAAHNSGKGAKYTRSRLPVRLVYWEKYATKQQAMQREAAIKQFSRQEKLQLLSEEGRKVVQEVAHKIERNAFALQQSEMK